MQLYQQLEKAQHENDETPLKLVACCIMALTPPTRLDTLYAFVRSDDMFICEHAIMLLEEYQYTPARDLLMKMTKEVLPNCR